jgi:GDP-mannose transporter
MSSTKSRISPHFAHMSHSHSSHISPAFLYLETVIVFRSCTPLAVCLFDYCFYDRARPGVRSTAALFLLVVGVFCYISSDRDFQLNGVAAYYFVLVWWSVLVS